MAVTTLKLNDGNEMPIIGMGTWAGLKDADQVEAAVFAGIAAGYCHFDCAYFYDNETEIGNAIRKAIEQGLVTREQLFITSKCWPTYFGKDRVRKCLQKSLDRLKLEYIDLYLLHWPMALADDDETTIPLNEDKTIKHGSHDILDTWHAMEQLKEEGLVKSIGVSNFNSVQVDRILKEGKVKPTVNQVESHPYLSQEKLLAHCEAADIKLTAYCPLGGRHKDKVNLLEDPVVKQIAEKHSKTVSQVLIRYQIERSIAVIPKSANPDRLKQNIDVFDFKLDEDDLKQLSALNRNHRVVDGNFDNFLGSIGGLNKHPEFPFNLEY